MTTEKIRVLIVDDSVFMRAMLKTAMTKAPHIEILATAQNGQEGLEKILSLKPDVVTLDVEMPGLNGLQVLQQVMKQRPTPCIMVSTKTQEGARITFDALELGAIDYVAKPLNQGASLEGFQEQVVQAVTAAFRANKKQLGKRIAPAKAAPKMGADLASSGIVVGIGISAGGPATLHKVLPLIPKAFPPILITQHMPADFTGPFAQRLNQACQLEVLEAVDGMELQPGRAILAHGDRHLRVRRTTKGLVAVLDAGPKVSCFRPSVDVLFKSLAETCGKHVVASVLTGMGSDGADGIRLLRKAGATTLSQDQETSVVYGMPKAAFDTGCVDRVFALCDFPTVLAESIQQRMLAHV